MPLCYIINHVSLTNVFTSYTNYANTAVDFFPTSLAPDCQKTLALDNPRAEQYFQQCLLAKFSATFRLENNV